MKQFLLLSVLVVLGGLGMTRGWAAVDPGDQFLEAYFLIQDGDAAERAGDWEKATTKYTAALDLLRQIKTTSPDWNPHIIEFRTKYCSGRLDELKSKIAAPGPTPEPAGPAATPAATQPAPEAPAAEPDAIQRLNAELQQARNTIGELQKTRDDLAAKLAEKLKEEAPAERTEAEDALEQLRTLQAAHEAVKAQLNEAVAKAAKADELTAQLQQSQEKIRTLEAERSDLTAKLQTALAQTAPTQSSPQIEDLMKENAELTAKLAAARSEIDDLHGKLNTTSPMADAEKIQLRADLAQTKQQLEQAQSENTQLKSSHDEIMAKLAESERQLRAVKVSNEKSDQIIQQLRKENSLLKEVVERNSMAGRDEEGTDGSNPSIPELKGWHPRKRRTVATQPQPTTPTQPPTPIAESQPSKLVASIKAPTPAASPKTSETTTPAKPPTPAKAPAPAPVMSVPSAPPKATATNLTMQTTTPVAAAAAAPPSVNVLLNEARAAFALKDFNTAETKYQAVLAQDPTNMTALSNIGLIEYKQGRLDAAEDTLRKVVAAAPNDSGSRSMLGATYFRKGEYEEAFGELTRAVALDPRNPEAHNYLGITLSKKGWQAAAEGEIRRALELNPQYADAHFNLAAIYARQKTPNLSLARYHYQKALDLGASPDPQMETLLKAPPPKPEESSESESKSAPPTTTP